MKTVLVTGGARGIGRAICLAFAEKSYNIAINYNRSAAAAQDLSKQLGGSSHMLVQADVSDCAQVEKMFADVYSRFGGVDILINNAGIAQQKLFTDITCEDWSSMMDINLGGTFHCCKAAVPNMIQRKSGCIINISSIWGMVGASCEVHYSASKAALLGFTKALAKELAPSDIRVNAVAPGIIETDMMAGFAGGEKAMLESEIPLRRFGTPEEIADAVLFLAESGYITGQILSPNGGFII